VSLKLPDSGLIVTARANIVEAIVHRLHAGTRHRGQRAHVAGNDRRNLPGFEPLVGAFGEPHILIVCITAAVWPNR
jgi:hypothetical protein